MELRLGCPTDGCESRLVFGTNGRGRQSSLTTRCRYCGALWKLVGGRLKVHTDDGES